jgi:hypothetical protein
MGMHFSDEKVPQNVVIAIQSFVGFSRALFHILK